MDPPAIEAINEAGFTKSSLEGITVCTLVYIYLNRAPGIPQQTPEFGHL
jgi:hypothetical protein